MEHVHTMSGLSQSLTLLAASVVIIMICRRLKLPPILGYLIVGMVIGPNAFDIVNAGESLELIAEFGIAFLLFSVGLEFSFPQMVAMRRTVFGMGSMQYFITGLVVAGLLFPLSGLDANAIIVLALALGMSSTAVVIKQLSEQGELHAQHGGIALGVLLFQDMVAIPALIIVAALQSSEGGSMETIQTLAKGVIAIGLMIAIGKYLLPKVLREVTKGHSKELFTLTILLIIIGAATATHSLELPIALGSFIAGMLLGGSKYCYRIEADIRPFKDVLLGLFFITIGMLVNPITFMDHSLLIILAAITLMAIKGSIVWFSSSFMQYPMWTSFRSAIVLAHVGEFGFAIISLAISLNLLPKEQAEIIIAIAMTTLFLAPIIVSNNKKISSALPFYENQDLKLTHDLQISSHHRQDHVVIFGFGKVGQTLGKLLHSKNMDYIALDVNASLIHSASASGQPVYYGSSSDHELLDSLHLDKARLVAITFNNKANAIKTISNIKASYQDIPIIVRSNHGAQNKELIDAGASEIILDPLESGLSFGAHALLMGGVEPLEVLSSTRKIRHSHYEFLSSFFQDIDFSSKSITESLPLEANHGIVNQTVSDMPLSRYRLKLIAIHRNSHRFELIDPAFKIKAKDILEIQGKPTNIKNFYQKVILANETN